MTYHRTLPTIYFVAPTKSLNLSSANVADAAKYTISQKPRTCPCSGSEPNYAQGDRSCSGGFRGRRVGCVPPAVHPNLFRLERTVVARFNGCRCTPIDARVLFISCCRTIPTIFSTCDSARPSLIVCAWLRSSRDHLYHPLAYTRKCYHAAEFVSWCRRQCGKF